MNFPEIPESAPFTAEQRQWLNGYLQDLVTTLQGGAALAADGGAAQKPVMVLYASQSGNAQGLAEGFAEELAGQKISARAVDIESADPAALANEEAVLVVASTWGEGDPPDTAVEFWNKFSGDDQPKLEGVSYSVLALGDTNYADFCQFGKMMDSRLGELGANRISDRVDCDVEFEDPARDWFVGVTTALKDVVSTSSNGAAVAAAPAAAVAPKVEEIPYGKKRPFPSKVLVNRRLNKPESPRDTRHYELLLDGSGLSYEVGDALAVVPENDPDMVNEIIKALPFKTDIQYESRGGEMVPFRDILLKDYDLRVVNKKIVNEWASRSHHPYLRSIVESGKDEEMTDFIWGREIVDLVVDFPAEFKSAEEFVKLLRKLGPRLYSIASSPNAHPGEVHLTVATVMYETHGRKRGGVCSTYLAQRVAVGESACVFTQPAKGFKLPEDTDRDVIMVGPGTGIAPFRAFTEERQISGAKGRNWMFFGNPHQSMDYFYEEEFEGWKKDGTLNRLDLAWSRDQAHKIYVQHLLEQHAETLWSWIDGGAHFYVCGDATYMAKDVDKALHGAVSKHGNMSEDAAKEYVAQMKKDKRYQRDVY
ncbi:MAG: flavodoxin domain-containing protein [Verrucomicrobiota bacterium]